MELSKNPVWEAFAWRVLPHALHGGSDFGECLATLERIGEGSADDWHREWTATADRVAAIAQVSDQRGHFISAREAYFRASNYYHASYFPLFGAPVDPRLTRAFTAEVAAFQRAAALSQPAIEPIEIPFEGRTLPGYFVRASSDPGSRPTIVQVNGYDSNIQEMYFAHGPAAVSRGYNCLLFDGPGQGRNLIRDGLVLRPDWENVVRAVIDYAVTRPEVDPWRIVLAGWGLGGFLAPRAAAFEKRIAALIADPGQWDQSDTVKAIPVPPELLRQKDSVPPPQFEQFEQWLRSPAADPMFRWRTLQRGMWTHGVNSLFELVKQIVRFEISPVAEHISCPTLLTAVDGDTLSRGAQKLFDALRCPKLLLRFTATEGSGGHCEPLARSLYEQRVFDWLDETLKSGGCLPLHLHLGRDAAAAAKPPQTGVNGSTEVSPPPAHAPSSATDTRPTIRFEDEGVFKRSDLGLPPRWGGGDRSS
ncbi:alpha/beta hydrolase family protein [Paludibaculum fermentans]|uniref:Alpha/beta fold hydrolase n=1 Tax=Paludibaculum fermentans TaxID=1473598 RepID=A0A7S7NWN4_PALFE|nr:alpha/beta fold hydrolase [Paludibaculum fermentans]QOY91168.1 alpha/beta fold hydrolase [Paludibaculum fermentans]